MSVLTHHPDAVDSYQLPDFHNQPNKDKAPYDVSVPHIGTVHVCVHVCIGAYVYVGTCGIASVSMCLWRQKDNLGFDPPELSPPP